MVDDRELILFGGDLIDVSEKLFRASCTGDGSDEFIQRIYEDWIRAGRPKRVPWLRQQLASEFSFVDQPPKWIEYSEWPFHLSRPMVFILQYTIPRNPVTTSFLAPDAEIYVFGARSPDSVKGHVGYWMQYRVVQQFHS